MPSGALSIARRSGVHSQIVANLIAQLIWPPHPRPRPSPGRGENPQKVSQAGRRPACDTFCGNPFYQLMLAAKNPNAPGEKGAFADRGQFESAANLATPPPAPPSPGRGENPQKVSQAGHSPACDTFCGIPVYRPMMAAQKCECTLQSGVYCKWVASWLRPLLPKKRGR